MVELTCRTYIVWSSGIMDCMLFTFGNGVHALRGASVVWHLSLSLLNSLNKTEDAISHAG